LDAGADGYCFKDVSSAELINAISRVLAGERYVSQAAAGYPLEQRTEQRQPCDCTILWSYFNRENFVSARMLNCTRSGCYFETPQHLSSRSTVLIRIEKCVTGAEDKPWELCVRPRLRKSNGLKSAMTSTASESDIIFQANAFGSPLLIISKDKPCAMDPLDLKSYLETRFDDTVEISAIRRLTGKGGEAEALKQFGYGRPFLVSCKIGDVKRRLVFHRIRPNSFGREREEDRVAAVWLDFRTFDRLPRHVTAVDLIIRTPDGKLKSIRDAEEMLLVTDYRDGRLYAEDLLRIRDNPTLGPLDLRRADDWGLSCGNPPGEARRPRPVASSSERPRRPRRRDHGACGQLSAGSGLCRPGVSTIYRGDGQPLALAAETVEPSLVTGPWRFSPFQHHF